ncbi:blue light receptor [Chytriomyces hyalinus]|nr:blue light receptor [Chytriomyces hyalinus]
MSFATAPPPYNNMNMGGSSGGTQESSRHVAAVLAHFTQSHEALGRLAQERDDVLVLLDRDRTVANGVDPLSITYISPSCMRVVRCTPASLFGKRFASLIHPDDVGLVLSSIVAVESSLTPRSIYCRLTRMDRVGEYVLVDAAIRVIDSAASTGANGPVKQYVMVAARVYAPTPIDTIHTLRIQNLQLRAALSELVQKSNNFNQANSVTHADFPDPSNLTMDAFSTGLASNSSSGRSNQHINNNSNNNPKSGSITAVKTAAAVSLLKELESIGWGADSGLSELNRNVNHGSSSATSSTFPNGNNSSTSNLDDMEYLPSGSSTAADKGKRRMTLDEDGLFGSNSGNMGDVSGFMSGNRQLGGSADMFIAPNQMFGDTSASNSASAAMNMGNYPSGAVAAASSGGLKKQKKVKIPVDELYCHQCGSTTSPEWRKGPLGPKTLCNACGLAYSKQVSKQKKLALKMEQQQQQQQQQQTQQYLTKPKGPNPSSSSAAINAVNNNASAFGTANDEDGTYGSFLAGLEQFAAPFSNGNNER